MHPAGTGPDDSGGDEGIDRLRESLRDAASPRHRVTGVHHIEPSPSSSDGSRDRHADPRYCPQPIRAHWTADGEQQVHLDRMPAQRVQGDDGAQAVRHSTRGRSSNSSASASRAHAARRTCGRLR